MATITVALRPLDPKPMKTVVDLRITTKRFNVNFLVTNRVNFPSLYASDSQNMSQKMIWS